MDEKVSKVGISPEESNYGSGLAYIAIPGDTNRSTYIADCYENMMVSLQTPHDGFINRAQISEEDLNLIIFPENYTLLGSPVYYAIDPINNQAFVLKVYANVQKLGQGKENAFRIGRKLGDSFVVIEGDASKESLEISVSGGNSAVNLAVVNESSNGQLNLLVDGNTTISSSKGTTFNQNRQLYSKTVDANDETAYTEISQNVDSIDFNSTKDINYKAARQIYSKVGDTEIIQKADGLNVNAAKIVTNNGDEPLALANKLKAFMGDLIKEISGAKVPTMFGLSPLLNSFQIMSYNQRVDEFISQVIFTDK